MATLKFDSDYWETTLPDVQKLPADDKRDELRGYFSRGTIIMSSIHLKHAKLWQTNEFNAEWIHNGAEYCRRDPDGKRDFEEALDLKRPGENCYFMRKHPGAEYLGPRPQTVSGVSHEALTAYTEHMNIHELVVPPRTKPAIKRMRGEGSISWLSRKHAAHLAGHKAPEMNWATSRALAISEFDRVRDTWEVWHTSPEQNPDKDWVRWHKFDDALRGRVYSLTLSHMVWLHASELLDDLFDMGLRTSSQIERAYKQDRHLMLRLIACYAKMQGPALHLWSNMTQVISASENIAPCLIRRRTRITGKSEILLDKSPAGEAAHELLNDLEHFMVHIVKDVRLPFTLCDVLLKELALDPHAADRFDSGAFHIFGELAIVYGFLSQMEQSTFGQGLMASSCALEAIYGQYCAP
ncbi:hypothetical protein C8J57DRAFT_1516323 [Mycena rebaudengoi]|nr:hypothetical protein C8J57DRAFT_1516323 [Mycena rebaudengoi]